jgi:hypothetical protein
MRAPIEFGNAAANKSLPFGNQYRFHDLPSDQHLVVDGIADLQVDQLWVGAAWSNTAARASRIGRC